MKQARGVYYSFPGKRKWGERERGGKFEKNWSKKHTAWKCDLTRGEISTGAKSRE